MTATNEIFAARLVVAKGRELMAVLDALAVALTTSEQLLAAPVAELTGTPNTGKVAVPSTTTTGRRGRPRKLP